MKRTAFLVFAGLLVLGAASAWAEEGRFVIAPAAGYRTSGSFGVRADIDLPISGVRLTDGFAYGLALGYRVNPNMAVEVLWAHSDPCAEGISNIPGSPDIELFDVDEDQFHANFLFYFGSNKMFRPFFITGLGLTAFNPRTEDLGNEMRFSWNLGLGLEKMFTDKIGVRATAKWFTTYINTRDEWMIDWWGNLWLVPVSQYMPQWDFTGSLIFRF